MSGDFSRKSFVPNKNLSAVLMQQGRVQLDSDWNEQTEIWNRRQRAQTIDTIGRATVPTETELGFMIEWDTVQQRFQIGRGRMYVDGILAENHGPAEGDSGFDPVLEESLLDKPVPLSNQPYLPDGDEPNPAGQNLFYLDVWQREVTHLQDRSLIESAVGVDTTARLQTIWQVKYLAGKKLGSNLITDLLKEKHPAAGGRLSTTVVESEKSGDPCLIPPSGGYRGLERPECPEMGL